MSGYKSNMNAIVDEITSDMRGIDSTMPGLVREVGTSIQASNLRRIHNNGLDEQLQPILGGTYSTKPTLVGAKSFATKGGANAIFGSREKRRKQEWRTITRGGRKHNLVLLRGGYKAIRQLSGRGTSKVDLNFTGKLSKEFGMQMIGNSVVLGFTTIDAIKKAKGLERRNGGVDIWGVTRDDVKNIEKIVNRRLKKFE